MSKYEDLPRLFKLNRLKDGKNISGTGKVIEGVVFPDGQVVVQWQTSRRSLGIYKNLKDFQDLHTKPIYEDENEFSWYEGYEPSQEVVSALDEVLSYIAPLTHGRITKAAKGELIGKIMAIKMTHEKRKRGGYSQRDTDYHARVKHPYGTFKEDQDE